MRSKKEIIISVLKAYIDNKDFSRIRLKAQEELTYPQQRFLNELISLLPNTGDHYEIIYRLTLKRVADKHNSEEVIRQLKRGDKGNLEKTLRCLNEIIDQKEIEEII